MPRRSSAKGGAFERETAKALSLWLTAGKDDTQLIRALSSGGWATKRTVRGSAAPGDWRQLGDLAPNGVVGDQFRKRYAVECKHRKEIDIGYDWLRHTADRKADTFMTWWTKLVRESAACDLRPLLIFRQNHQETLVALTLGDVRLLGNIGTAPFMTINPDGVHPFAIGRFTDLLASDPARVLQPIDL
jgi:hypothetical protein